MIARNAWQLTANGTCTKLSAMEYRSDGGRRRYMVRPRDVNTFAPLGGESAGAWHDYEADDIWGDYNDAMNGQTPVISEAMAHTPGVGRFAPGGAGPRYDHGNLIGTTETMTSSLNIT